MTRDDKKNEKAYPLGPQRDGSIVLRVGSDFDLMILRKAVERHGKNAGAAVGTVSALADGEDEFIDAVQRSVERLAKVINSARAPESQISDTPIGKEMKRASAEAGSSPAKKTDEPQWAEAVPVPRPKNGDVVELPDGKLHDVTLAIGFKGEGLTGAETPAELKKIADEGKLSGVFVVSAQNLEGSTLLRQAPHVRKPDDATNVWRVPGFDEDYAELDARRARVSESPSSGNVGEAASAAVEKAKGSRKAKAAKEPTKAPSGRKRGRPPKKK